MEYIVFLGKKISDKASYITAYNEFAEELNNAIIKGDSEKIQELRETLEELHTDLGGFLEE